MGSTNRLRVIAIVALLAIAAVAVSGCCPYLGGGQEARDIAAYREMQFIRAMNPAAKSPLYSVSFPTPLTGWAVGQKGTIVNTVDGGKTWTPQKSGTPIDLNDVHFTDPDNGIAVGTGGAFLQTTDGGRTWKPLQIAGACLFDIGFFDTQRGWVVGNYGQIYATTDGGRKWTAQVKPDMQGGMPLDVVAFGDPDRGAVFGPGRIGTTSDGGKTWTFGASDMNHLAGVANKDASTGWAVGLKGAAYATTDGWATFKKIDIGTTDDLVGITYVAGGTPAIYVLTAKGDVYSSADGVKWTKVAVEGPAPAVPVTAAQFLPGADGSIGVYGVGGGSFFGGQLGPAVVK